MVNKDLILAYLNEYDENELIYKEYHEALKNPDDLEEFGRRHGLEEVLAKRLVLPQLYEESLPPEDFFCDRNIFRNGQNILLMKHDRYTPAFAHHHDTFELNYVVSGSCRQLINGTEVHFYKGDICFIALDTTHTMEVFDDSIVLNILIRKDTFDDIFINVLRNKSILTTFFLDNLYAGNKTDYIIFSTAGDEEIEGLIFEMFLESMAEDEYSGNLSTYMISILFSKLLRGYSKTAVICGKQGEDMDLHNEIVVYLQNNYITATLQDTAAHFGYDPSYCSRLIKKVTGVNFVGLVREIRMKQAERLLRATPMTVEMISERIGYENPETFIRVFKKSRGMTPAQYRNEKLTQK